MDLDAGFSPHLSETSIVAVCANPLLPQVFRPVCHTKGAGLVLSELGKSVQKNSLGYMLNMDVLKLRTQLVRLLRVKQGKILEKIKKWACA